MALTNAQYDEIMREYDKRQLHNRSLTEQRKARLYRQLPRLLEIEHEIAASSLQQAKLLLNGQTNALAALKEKLAALSGERTQLLLSNGYDADYLEPVYTCADCHDTGYIDGRRCHCLRQAIIDKIYVQSNIRDILANENFDAFSYQFYSDEEIHPTTKLSSLATAQAAVATCHDLIDHFQEENASTRNLFFYGDTGVGKTFLSNCVAKELLDKGYSVIYFTAFQLFDILSKGVFERDADAIAAHQNIFDCDLLVIDDLGTELSNTFTVSQLFLCVNERILRGKATIISTNLGIGQMTERYSERTFSRIMEHYSMIKLFTPDIRVQKRRI